MNASRPTSPKRGPAAARLLAGLLASSILLPWGAPAAEITNTATVSYRPMGSETTLTLRSNTVVTPLADTAVAGRISLSRIAPEAGGHSTLDITGGQCRIEPGRLVTLPPVSGPGGTSIDGSSAQVVGANAFPIGEAVVITVADAGGNLDPGTRDYADVEITTSTGDVETLRLRETGPDTGVFAGAIGTVAVPPAPVVHDCVLALDAGADIVAKYVDPDFPELSITASAVAQPGLPADRTAIRLEQSVSRDIVEVGDFLLYTLVVRNIHDAPATNVRIRDVLPPGVRLRAGSLRVGQPVSATGIPTAAAGMSTGAGGVQPMQVGSTKGAGTPSVDMVAGTPEFSFPVGNLAPGESATATFVAEVGPGARGQHLLNFAVATADGAISSNETDTVVRMRESLNSNHVTIIGRVAVVDRCDAPGAERVGMPGVRVMLEDGTFTATDAAGAYHFEGVRPGTHVVQVDTATLPGGVEVVRCGQDSRFAGSAHSQFVEAQGGTMWRADFQVRHLGAVPSEVGMRVASANDDRIELELDGGPAEVSGLRAIAMLPAGTTYVAGSARLDGQPFEDPEVSGNAVVFDLGDTGANWRRRIAFQVDAASCPPVEQPVTAVAVFRADGKSGVRTPTARLPMACGPPHADRSGERSSVIAAVVPQGVTASPFAERQEIRAAIPGDVEASGAATRDWFAGQAPGRDWVFPRADYNPRAPIMLVVVKHLPGDQVALRINGQPVPAVNFDGSEHDAARTMSVAKWRGVGLAGGENLLQAEISDASGQVVATLERTVHFTNTAARAELVPEQSILVADGVHGPVIAVRMLDGSGHPVRHGVSGSYAINSPYAPAFDAGVEQSRLLDSAGSAPRWTIEGDDGIAYIELEPTGTAGSFTLDFPFGADEPGRSRQQVTGWLKSAPRDWIVVGFAKGSVGYAVLDEHLELLPEGEDASGIRTDGQVALYAKGRVMGKWLLTMAYDSDKQTDRLRGQGLLSTIDPGQYYTLYGDGTQQGYDASSARKLYLKLERDQFYALFGDFQTGLDRAELSRYQRTLNGMKVEYRGPLVEFNGFAAKTAQDYLRDEIQGDGTSGLYRLRHSDVVLNSERVRIETRDRYHSEQIIEARELVRHIDYDIDYERGTLFFRQPIASRDFDFNPIWIVVEYETRGTGETFVNAGGRVGVHAMDGRLEAGATYIRDEDSVSSSRLAGVDARFRLTSSDELRAEFARTSGEVDEQSTGGDAWLMEWEHRGEQFSLLAYARRQTPGFGLGQQNRYESGMAKAGVQGQYRVGPRFSLRGEAYRQEDLATGAKRDVANAEAQFSGEDWNARAGLQWARDRAPDGTTAESRQVTVGGSKWLMDRRLELGARADFSLGGANESVDFPTRVQLTAGYRVSDAFRILGAQEFTDGKDRDTSTTRIGFEAKPWTNATLTSTLNQAQVSEYGPRTFALFGLNQKFVLDQHWSFDVALDSSRSFNESGRAPLVIDPSQPIQAGGIRDGGALTEDFVALSTGATYRTDLWMWNARAEARTSDDNDRYGFTSAFLRQIRDGIALSASMQAFSRRNVDGSVGVLANAQLSWAYRPLDSNWSILEKLEFRLDRMSGGAGGADIRSRRLVNNVVLNHGSDAWDGEDTRGVLDFDQRSEFSLYYGSKYVMDSFGEDDYSGYTDLLGAEWRYDLSPKFDIGLRVSVLHSWSQETYAWAIGPSIGFTPFTNAWLSLGYNVRGFDDRDFGQAHHTGEGAYLVFRLKFDQHTFGLDRTGADKGR